MGAATITVGSVDTITVTDRASGALIGLIADARRVGASDVHIRSGQRPRRRVDGILEDASGHPVGVGECELLVAGLAPAGLSRDIAAGRDVDFAAHLPETGRMRVSVFRCLDGIGLVARLIPAAPPGPEQLGLPARVADLADLSDGLVLVAGASGSGKSTTVASLVDRVNRTRPVHVLTIEDPVEYVHESKVATVTQRQVGPDADGWSQMLRRSLRQDPDVIVFGEVRDRAGARACLTCAETGHLVFATVHSSDALSVPGRLLDLIGGDTPGNRRTVADVLRAIVWQRLVGRPDGGRIAAVETLTVSTLVADAIRDPAGTDLARAARAGAGPGVDDLDGHLVALACDRLIGAGEAIGVARNTSAVRRELNRVGVGEH